VLQYALVYQVWVGALDCVWGSHQVLLVQRLHRPRHCQQGRLRSLVCLYRYLQTTINLNVLTNYINSDKCTAGNINDPMPGSSYPLMPGSMYPPLWHAVAHAIEQGDDASFATLKKVIGKMDGLDFLATLTDTNITLAEFLARLSNIQGMDKKIKSLLKKLDDVNIQ
jgi:hypothetical protein